MSISSTAPKIKKPTQSEIKKAQISAVLEDSKKAAADAALKAMGEADEILKIFPSDEITPENKFLELSITPEMASGLITNQFMPSFQRDLNKDNKEQYKNDIKNGDFDISTLTFGVVRESNKNKFYNIDGKTRLNAVAEGGSPIRFNVVFNKYDSLHDVQTAYTKIDCGRKRNFTDKLTALEILKDKNVPSQLASKMGGIISIINGGFPGSFSGKRNGANNDALKISEVEKHIKAISAYGIILKIDAKSKKLSDRQKTLLNVGVAAAGIYLLHNHGKQSAPLFSGNYLTTLVACLGNITDTGDTAKAKQTRIVEKLWIDFCADRAVEEFDIDTIDGKSKVTFLASVVEELTESELKDVASLTPFEETFNKKAA